MCCVGCSWTRRVIPQSRVAACSSCSGLGRDCAPFGGSGTRLINVALLLGSCVRHCRTAYDGTHDTVLTTKTAVKRSEPPLPSSSHPLPFRSPPSASHPLPTPLRALLPPRTIASHRVDGAEPSVAQYERTLAHCAAHLVALRRPESRACGHRSGEVLMESADRRRWRPRPDPPEAGGTTRSK